MSTFTRKNSVIKFLRQFPALQDPKKVLFANFFLKGKETTELAKLLGIFEHTLEEWKKKIPSLNYKIW